MNDTPTTEATHLPAALPLSESERAHGRPLNGVVVFHEVAVGRVIADRQREWENAVLRECVANMPATGDCADFMSVVSTAMLTLRTPPEVSS